MNSVHVGKPAQITFTLDYHELVRGDLRANANCRISYDPVRIVPRDGTYTHGDPNQPIVVHAQFQENGSIESKTLWSPIGIVKDPHIDPTGHGAMLFQEFHIPKDAEELIVWFSYFDPDTHQTYYDEDYGKKFRFRWPYHDVQVRKADITSDRTNATSSFELEVNAIPSITQVSVQWSVINSPHPLKDEVALNDTDREDGNKIWSVKHVVPHGAIVRFQLFYEVNGRQYKNDNASKYFLAPQPKRIEVPPPPKAPIRV